MGSLEGRDEPSVLARIVGRGGALDSSESTGCLADCLADCLVEDLVEVEVSAEDCLSNFCFLGEDMGKFRIWDAKGWRGV